MKRMTGNQESIKQGLILGLERVGCVYIKEDENYVYLAAPEDIDHKKLMTVNNMLHDRTGLKLKVAL